jgi:hypothetical protein
MFSDMVNPASNTELRAKRRGIRKEGRSKAGTVGPPKYRQTEFATAFVNYIIFLTNKNKIIVFISGEFVTGKVQATMPIERWRY